MEPREVRRIVIPLIVGGVALLVLLVFTLGRRPTPPAAPPAPAPEVAAAPEAPPEPIDPAPLVPDPDVEQEPERVDPVEPPDPIDPVEPEEPEHEQPAIIAPPVEAPANGVTLEGLRTATLEPAPGVDPAAIGSLDPSISPIFVEFNRIGGGIARIILSDHWEIAWAKREADAHFAAVAAGDLNPPPLPGDEWRYLLKEQESLHGTMVPIFAAHSIEISDPDSPVPQRVSLWTSWTETAPGQFEITVVNDNDEPVLHITRRFDLQIGEAPVRSSQQLVGDITLEQRVQNLSGRDLTLRWWQYGPGDLELERARYFDSRRFRFGYLRGTAADPQEFVFSEDNRLVMPRTEVVRRYDSQEDFHLWPNRRSIERQYMLSWFAATNRYFALAVHPVLDEYGRGDRSFADVVEEIQYMATAPRAADAAIFTFLVSPERGIAPAETLALDLGIYAGPMDRHILSQVEPFASLGMEQLILYMMSTWCAICTFQWLAHFLMWIMSFLHDWVLLDWGLAIIVLVCFVRLLLHPITKRSQINMMRFGKQMQKMRPDIEKLQKKYKDEPKKLQQEQLRLMREHGVNPFQMLGCLPLFLQIPIWIALYAMLYFAFDIRHQPAFFGIFQWITAGAWPFLADLSTGDHFLGEFREPFQLIGYYNITGLNVLPIVLGVVFFIQQKYMTPPPSATMSPEQIQQQKIMRIMLVVMMPILLYPAPAGLTLYIITSSVIGIIESKYVRAHVDQMDLEGPPAGPAGAPKKPKPKKPRDPQSRAYAQALERAEKEQKRKKKGPAPSWKKRK